MPNDPTLICRKLEEMPDLKREILCWNWGLGCEMRDVKVADQPGHTYLPAITLSGNIQWWELTVICIFGSLEVSVIISSLLCPKYGE